MLQNVAWRTSKSVLKWLLLKKNLYAITFQNYLPFCIRLFICRIFSSRTLLTAITDWKESKKKSQVDPEKKVERFKKRLPEVERILK